MQLKTRRRKEIRGSWKAYARPRILAAALRCYNPRCVGLGCAGRMLVGGERSETPSYQDKHTPCCQSAYKSMI